MITKSKMEIESDDNETEFESETETRYRWVEESDCSLVEEEEEIEEDEYEVETISKEVVGAEMCEDIKEAIRERNRIRFENRTGQECIDGCSCRGVVMTCTLEDGTTEMTVFAGESGNIIIKIRGVNMTTNVTLYHHDGRIFGNFTDGEGEIKITPDEIKVKVKERLKSKFIDEETEIELKDDGVYKFKTMKRARLFFVIPVGEDVEADIDAETGQFFKIKGGPWWGFLANDVE